MKNLNREYEVPRMSVIHMHQEDVITDSNRDNWELSYEEQF